MNPLRVLLIDDNVQAAETLGVILRYWGYEVRVAFGGPAGLDAAADFLPGLILLDINMPEMNGFEATEYIRNIMQSSIPIIALTADVTTADLQKCTAVGMNDYVPKPIDEKLLYNKIIYHLKKNLLDTNDCKIKKMDESILIKYVNLDYLNARTKSNQQLMKEMILLYLEQTPPLIDIIKTSLLEKDWAALHAAVHKIIPSFSIMGIDKEFEDIAVKVQHYAIERQQGEEITALVAQLESVCHGACNELKYEFENM